MTDLGLIKIFSMSCDIFFLFLHVLVVAEGRKNDMGAIGVVETGYGHGHKVGWIWFGIRRSLAARKMGGGGRKSSLLVYFSMSVCEAWKFGYVWASFWKLGESHYWS